MLVGLQVNRVFCSTPDDRLSASCDFSNHPQIAQSIMLKHLSLKCDRNCEILLEASIVYEEIRDAIFKKKPYLIGKSGAFEFDEVTECYLKRVII